VTATMHSIGADRPGEVADDGKAADGIHDTDPKQAAGSRVKMLDMLGANKMAVISCHYPWPGYGHVVETGEGFQYLSEPMNMII
jgi:hypothetical protein